jgi:hypothetical protein
MSRDSSIDTYDTYADNLMDDLFGEVEHILETGAAPPEQEAHTQFVAIKPLLVPQIPSGLVPVLSPEEDENKIVAVDAELTRSKPITLQEKLLAAAVLFSFGMMIGLWWVSPNRYTALVAHLSGQEEASTLAGSSSAGVNPDQERQNQEFVQYMERSLKLIDEQKTAPEQAVAVLPPPVDNLPTIAVPGTPGVAASPPTATPVERVYIPIYQTPQATVPVTNLPNPKLPAPGALPQIPVPGSVATTPGSALAPAAITPPASTAPAVASAVPPLVPTTTHTLVGILELGDRSAALFEINGVTRRINLGEAIGSSGWSLVEVVNQEAVVRRNGEVRSVYVGQSF